MKKILSIIAAGFIFGLSTLPAKAQDNVRPVPSWVSDRGYWVVENHGDSSTIYFYNNDNRLVYRERVAGTVNADKRKIKLRLTGKLEQAVTAWERDRQPDSVVSRQNASVYRQMINGVKNAGDGQ